MEHYDNFVVLLAGMGGCLHNFHAKLIRVSLCVTSSGRVLGGITTALLFTAFDSWMVTEHRRKGFSEDLLSDTYS